MSLKDERETMEAMVRLYCRTRHKSRELCSECAELLTYGQARLAGCVFGEEKPVCRLCPVHCYRPTMRTRMTEVMRTMGPRMLFHHPIRTIRHMLHERKPVPPPKRGV